MFFFSPYLLSRLSPFSPTLLALAVQPLTKPKKIKKKKKRRQFYITERNKNSLPTGAYCRIGILVLLFSFWCNILAYA
jgi:hypothetical protein